MTTKTPTALTRQDIPSLVALLTEQRDAYRQLSALGAQQGDLIAAGQTEQLLTVLSQRQTWVDRIGKLNEQLTPYHASWEQLSRSLDDQQRPRIGQLLDEVKTLLNEQLQQDDKDREQLLAAQQKIGSQLSQTARTGSALHAYKGSAATDARFTDRQG
jgi:hypothetical protein